LRPSHLQLVQPPSRLTSKAVDFRSMQRSAQRFASPRMCAGGVYGHASVIAVPIPEPVTAFNHKVIATQILIMVQFAIGRDSALRRPRAAGSRYVFSVMRALSRSADFQSAVSPNCIRQGVGLVPRVGVSQRPAECNSAIRQSTTLRYDVALNRYRASRPCESCNRHTGETPVPLPSQNQTLGIQP
jgi:hypothetical protein